MPYPNQETYTKEQMILDAEKLMEKHKGQSKKFLFIDDDFKVQILPYLNSKFKT